MDKIEQARSWLLWQRPFYGTLALQLLKWEERAEFPAPAGTDGKRVIINPDLFNERPLHERGFITAHEVMHVVCDHCGASAKYRKRGLGPDGKPFDMRKANVATDYVVNHLLAEDGLAVPRDACVAPPGFHVGADTTWEDVYVRLPDQVSRKGFDEHMEGSLEDAEQQRTQVLRAVAQAVETARKAGNVPAFAERMIEALAKPHFNLKDALVEELLARGRGEDWSYRRPRKQRLVLPPGLFLPSQIACSAGVVVVGIDVSGSIDDKTANYFGAVLEAALNEVSFDELWVATIECDVTSGRQLQDAAELKDFLARVAGGGGTYMPALFPWIDRQGITPTQVVVLTDGYTDFGTPPSWPVSWCITTGVKAPWGKTFQVEVDE